MTHATKKGALLVWALLAAVPAATAQETEKSAPPATEEIKKDAPPPENKLVEESEPESKSRFFTGSRLFVNQSMHYDVGRTFGVGLNFTIAPVKAAQKKLVDEFKKSDPVTYGAMLEAAQYVNPDDIKGLDPEQFKQQLLSVATLDPEQRAAIESADVSGYPTDMVADVLEIMQNPDTTITFSLEPYAEFHLGPVDLSVVIPLAGFAGDETKFTIGNIGLDTRIGGSWGKGVAAGITGGVSFWAPTATEAANALGLANLMWSPRYFSQYTTVAPYFVAGADLMFVTIQASVAYNAMIGVKGEPDHDLVQFLQYGGSLAVTAIPYIVISVELSGLADISNAPAYSALLLTPGLRFSSSFVDIGLAFQVPLVQKGSSEFAGFSNLSFGSPSSFNVIASATFGF